MQRIFQTLIASFTVGLMVISVNQTAHGQNLRFQHISVEDGLTQDIVTAIAQDSLGFMWFGTEDGLNRYDGYGVTVYKHHPSDTTSISSNNISTLMTDSQGRLWIGTATGANLAGPSAGRVTRVRHPETESAGVSAFGQLEDSTVLILTLKDLFKYDRTGIVSRLTEVNGASLGGKVLLVLPGERRIIIGTSTGLRVFDIVGDSLASVDVPAFESLNGLDIFAVTRPSRNEFFICALNTGFYRIRTDLGKVERYEYDAKDVHSLSDNRVLTVASDHAGRIWVGTFSGLNRFDPASGRFLRVARSPSGLRGDRVYSLCVERGGALWVGTFRGGVNRLDPYRQKFGHVPYEPGSNGGLGSPNVLAIIEDHAGDLWVGTDEGLFRRRHASEGFQRYTNIAGDVRSLSANGILAICQRRNGELWAGGVDGTLNHYQPSTNRFRRYPLPVRNSVRVIFETSGGRLLVGTESRGAYVLDTVQQRFVPWLIHSSAEAPAGVWAMHQDRSGLLWIGTWFLPYLVRFDPVTQQADRVHADPKDKAALLDPAVRTFCEVADNSLYLGTWPGGLGRYDRTTDRYTWYSELDGLSSNYIKGMQADERGRIWIATEKGMSRFDIASGSFRNYTVDDGLQSNFFWSGSTYKGNDGLLYFGGTNGFTVFHPDSIKDNTSAPPVVITSVRVLDKPVEIPVTPTEVEPLSLTHEEDFISFEFVALDYSSPARNTYAYMMEGADKNWVSAGTRRFTSYSRLDPGKYVFRVKGSNGDGVWNEAGASMTIVVLPPYWMTWWFRLLVGVSVAAGLYALYRYRLNQVLTVERLRQRIGRDLHDDIGTNLSAIVIASQVVRQQKQASADVLRQVDDIGSIASKTQELMRDIVWMLNPKNDTLKEFVARMKHEAASLLKGVNYKFTAPDGELPSSVSLDFKRNVFLVYKEALNNIVRHSHASHVEIDVQRADNVLRITVSDNGNGFDAHVQHTGNGLLNMHSRAQHIGAVLTVVSSAGAGCSVVLEAKIT